MKITHYIILAAIIVITLMIIGSQINQIHEGILNTEKELNHLNNSVDDIELRLQLHDIPPLSIEE